MRRLGYELWDLDYGRGPHGACLRVFIESLGGATLDDCVRVSRELEPTLDVEDCVPGPYTLEVSSPGLDRLLRTETHFRRFIGSHVSVQLKEPMAGRRNFDGKLVDASSDGIEIEQNGQTLRMSLPRIQRAQVVFDWRGGARVTARASGRSAKAERER